MAESPIVLYDGVCGLCNGAVQWLLRHDRDGVLRFAPLQGETATALRAKHEEIGPDLDTVVLVDGDRVYVRSAALIRLTRWLPFPWNLGRLLGALPTWVLDGAYRIVAALRYRVFGRHPSCTLPTAAQRGRFLP